MFQLYLTSITENFKNFELKDGKVVESTEQHISKIEFDALVGFAVKQMKLAGVEIKYVNQSGTENDKIILTVDGKTEEFPVAFSKDIDKTKGPTVF